MENQHFTSHNCRKKPVHCTYCDGFFPADQHRLHADACGSRTDRCDRCREYIQKKYFAQHISENNCFIRTPPVISNEELKKEAAMFRKVTGSKESKYKAPVNSIPVSYPPVHENALFSGNPAKKLSPPPGERNPLLSASKPQRFVKNPDKPVISAKIEPKVNRGEFDMDIDGEMNEAPAVVRPNRNSPVPQRRNIYQESGPGNLGGVSPSTRNLLDDEEQILRSVIEESKRDMGEMIDISEEDRILNEAIYQSMNLK